VHGPGVARRVAAGEDQVASGGDDGELLGGEGGDVDATGERRGAAADIEGGTVGGRCAEEGEAGAGELLEVGLELLTGRQLRGRRVGRDDDDVVGGAVMDEREDGRVCGGGRCRGGEPEERREGEERDGAFQRRPPGWG
jgi:hypothetical protein